MITLECGGRTPNACSLGPADAFTIKGNFIRCEPDGSVVARYERQGWHSQGKHFSHLTFPGPAVLYFRDAEGDRSELLGPFQHVVYEYGCVYADKVRVATFIQQSDLWHAERLQTYWHALVVASPN